MVSVRAAESNRVSRTYHGELTPNAASNSCSVCIAIAPFLIATGRDETIIYPLEFRKRRFIIERTGSPRALEYLIGSLDDTIWRRRDVRGVVTNSMTQDM